MRVARRDEHHVAAVPAPSTHHVTARVEGQLPRLTPVDRHDEDVVIAETVARKGDPRAVRREAGAPSNATWLVSRRGLEPSMFATQMSPWYEKVTIPWPTWGSRMKRISSAASRAGWSANPIAARRGRSERGLRAVHMVGPPDGSDARLSWDVGRGGGDTQRMWDPDLAALRRCRVGGARRPP